MKKSMHLASLAIPCLLAVSCINVEPSYDRNYDPNYDPNCETPAPQPRYGPAGRERPQRYDRRVEIVHLQFGEMDMSDDDFWRPLDEPWAFGIEYASTTTDTGFGPEIGFHLWGDSTRFGGADEDLSGVEFSAGVRNTWDAGRNRPHPYIGVGGTLLAANLESPTYDESDGSLGLYAHAGITLPLGSGLEAGLDYRVVRGTESDLPGLAESDYDYDRLAIVLGWSF